jgi:hypothetical protein
MFIKAYLTWRAIAVLLERKGRLSLELISACALCSMVWATGLIFFCSHGKNVQGSKGGQDCTGNRAPLANTSNGLRFPAHGMAEEIDLSSNKNGKDRSTEERYLNHAQHASNGAVDAIHVLFGGTIRSFYGLYASVSLSLLVVPESPLPMKSENLVKGKDQRDDSGNAARCGEQHACVEC